MATIQRRLARQKYRARYKQRRKEVKQNKKMSDVLSALGASSGLGKVLDAIGVVSGGVGSVVKEVKEVVDNPKLGIVPASSASWFDRAKSMLPASLPTWAKAAIVIVVPFGGVAACLYWLYKKIAR